ncbi:hypothetical protein HJD18_10640 [Thermoleophilia bacterium SCSIO 60948]|nr:hypothetical protein HJD18_10640 [Thermoleophilia bacterium SCSIO 60948]
MIELALTLVLAQDTAYEAGRIVGYLAVIALFGYLIWRFALRPKPRCPYCGATTARGATSCDACGASAPDAKQPKS